MVRSVRRRYRSSGLVYIRVSSAVKSRSRWQSLEIVVRDLPAGPRSQSESELPHRRRKTQFPVIKASLQSTAFATAAVAVFLRAFVSGLTNLRRLRYTLRLFDSTNSFPLLSRPHDQKYNGNQGRPPRYRTPKI